MNTNVYNMIVKPENIMKKSDKCLKAFSLFTSVPCVALIVTKSKTEISSVLPIFCPAS